MRKEETEEEIEIEKILNRVYDKEIDEVFNRVFDDMEVLMSKWREEELDFTTAIFSARCFCIQLCVKYFSPTDTVKTINLLWKNMERRVLKNYREND